MIIRIALILICVSRSYQHGYMFDPPSRSSLWREPKFRNNPRVQPNYNDNQLYCGGRAKIQSLGGLCGPCGDPHDGKRENEAGGKYGVGIISRSLPDGATTLTAKVRITAYHKGHFEFRICAHDDPTTPVSQNCLNKNLMEIQEAEPHEPTKFQLTEPNRRDYELTLILPKGIKCKQCVLQWRYRTGNSWGRDIGGRSCLGCGVQEEFRNCADISIGSGDVPSDQKKIDSSRRPVDISGNIDWRSNALPSSDVDPTFNRHHWGNDVKVNIDEHKDNMRDNDITKTQKTEGRNEETIKLPNPTVNVPKPTIHVPSPTMNVPNPTNSNNDISKWEDALLKNQIDGQKRVNDEWRSHEKSLQKTQIDIQQQNIDFQKEQIRAQKEIEQSFPFSAGRSKKEIEKEEKQQLQNQINTQTSIRDNHQRNVQQQQRRIFDDQMRQISLGSRNRFDNWAKEQRRRQQEQLQNQRQRLLQAQWRDFRRRQPSRRFISGLSLTSQRNRNFNARSDNRQTQSSLRNRNLNARSGNRQTETSQRNRNFHLRPKRIQMKQVQPKQQEPRQSETISHAVWPWRSGIPIPRHGISSGFSNSGDDLAGNKMIMISPNPPNVRSELDIRRAIQELRKQASDSLWFGQFRKQKTREITLNADGEAIETTATPAPSDSSIPPVPKEIMMMLEKEMNETDIYNNNFNVISPHSIEGMRMIQEWTMKLKKLYLSKKISKTKLKELLIKFKALTDQSSKSSPPEEKTQKENTPSEKPENPRFRLKRPDGQQQQEHHGHHEEHQQQRSSRSRFSSISESNDQRLSRWGRRSQTNKLKAVF
ncbi:hypothetical protein FSP39_019697 [Pinctada imbricata]|uniref:Chitin-binding type-4 domain-containing protein n=1 Tax=Pinctada imbricata TaxID=66713 RepID=A0AA88YA30_PINIB|nr:hypothetical protein FSP39_019697 [Pinctada imbricata]